MVSCAELVRAPALGRCAPGAQTATIEPGRAGTKFQPPAWPAADIRPDELTPLPVQTLVVATSGSRAAIERARTLLELVYPQTDAPITVTEQLTLNGKQTAAYQQLATVVIIATLPIAGVTLAVSVVAGLNERKRPFSLLRLTGAPLRVLQRVVVIESAVFATRRRGGLHRDGLPGGIPVPALAALRDPATARPRVLRRRSRRPSDVASDHRLDPACATPGHRPRDRAQRIAAPAAEKSGCRPCRTRKSHTQRRNPNTAEAIHAHASNPHPGTATVSPNGRPRAAPIFRTMAKIRPHLTDSSVRRATRSGAGPIDGSGSRSLARSTP